MDIVIASSNPGKIREIEEIFANLPAKLSTRTDFQDWPEEIEETGGSYLANARIKAHAIAGLTGKPALADDSGIEVDALDGAPGPDAAIFAGSGATEEENNQKLISLISGIPTEKRTARYRCVVVLALPGGDEVAAVGTCEGRIATEARGDGGFGYDPWFIPVGGSRTMAELTAEEKHAISHRGEALRSMAEKLRPLLAQKADPRQSSKRKPSP